MSRKVDWFGVWMIIALAALVLTVVFVLGRTSLSLISTANAGEAVLTWEAPTQNCNGTSLTDLSGYDLTYGQKREALPKDPLAKTITGLLPGSWWFSLAAVTPTDRSEFITVEKVVPPEEFVTTGTTIYTFFRSNGNITVLPTSHTVPLGVVCDATQSVNGKYKVPLEAVTWAGAKLTAALADCG